MCINIVMGTYKYVFMPNTIMEKQQGKILQWHNWINKHFHILVSFCTWWHLVSIWHFAFPKSSNHKAFFVIVYNWELNLPRVILYCPHFHVKSWPLCRSARHLLHEMETSSAGQVALVLREWMLQIAELSSELEKWENEYVLGWKEVFGVEKMKTCLCKGEEQEFIWRAPRYWNSDVVVACCSALLDNKLSVTALMTPEAYR